MGTKLSELLPLITEKENTKSFNFRDNLNNYLYHWPLYFICFIVSIGGAFVYLEKQNPVYNIKATVIIKDDKKEPDERENLEKLDVSSSPKLAENEVEVFTSRNLIGQVVNDLQLWVKYQKKDGLKAIDLYKSSPVIFKILDTLGNIGGQVFKIKINDNNSFSLIKTNGEFRKFNFNENLENEFGVWKLIPTKNIKKFIGGEMQIFLNNPSRVAEKYQKLIDADMPNKLAPTIELSLKDEVEQRGNDILDSLISFYNESTIAAKNQITRRTLDFIDSRIGSLASELNTSEKDVEDFRSSRGLADISSQSKTYLENVQTNDNKLNEVNVQLNIIDNIEQYINSSQNVQNASASLGINYPSLNSLIEKLSTLQLQKDKLLATVPESNPMYDPINRQIKATKADIKDNIQNIKTALLAAKGKLESFSSKFESSIKNIPIQERQLVDKTRQQNIKENLYVYLLQKREEVGLNYASILPDARIVDYAYASSPQTQTLLVCGTALLLSLILPSGIIYTRKILNNRITSRREIEEATDISIIGELSQVKTSSSIVASDNSNVIMGEEIRALRTNLHFLYSGQDKGKVILITSSISNEGKSFVTTNLGIVLAVAGKKTIILEMDLRRPKVLTGFNLQSSNRGITEYLVDGLPTDRIIQNSNVHKNLDLIGSGILPSDPSELLLLAEIDSLVNSLRLKYDYILIDTPPVNLVTDAKILSRLSDINLYVIRQAYTYKSLLPFIKALNGEQQFRNMRIVFNGIEKQRYGYGYNYGTEYYQKIAQDKKTKAHLMFSDFFKRF